LIKIGENHQSSLQTDHEMVFKASRAAKALAFFGLIGGLHAFQHAPIAGISPCKVMHSSEKRGFPSFNIPNRKVGRLGMTMSSRSTLRSGEDTIDAVDFVKYLAQSALLATSGTMLVNGMATLPRTADFNVAESSAPLAKTTSTPSKFERSYEIRCITDGFEFSQYSGIQSDNGEARSYRQCEAMGNSPLGLL
jgi:hypothetical protein